MLARKAYEELLFWKSHKTKQALLVSGARQVGKTYLVRDFGAREYESLIDINLLENASARDALASARSADEVFQRLTLLADSPLVPGKTLIFLDEVQECPDLVTYVKFLVDTHGEFDYVLSGSLLGTELKNVRSWPVGYLHEVQMYPLDFEEYCWARGVQPSVIDSLHESFDYERPVDEFAHEHMLTLFHEYLVIGGMPDAVSSFCETRNIQAVRTIQQDIVNLYKADITKYCDEKDALSIKAIYDLMPSELNAQNKRFVVSDLGQGRRFDALRNNFLWLTAAGIALDAYNVDAPVYPLLASKKASLFKLYFSDTGLLTSRYMRQTSLDVLDKKPGVNYGGIYENAVAQELKAHGFDLYYYVGTKRGELDFLVETRDGEVLPIEVKSGKDYKRHSALTGALKVEDWHIGRALVLSEGNLERVGAVLYAPIYLGMFLKNE